MTTGETHGICHQRGAAETSTRRNDLPPLSEDDRRRLMREWSDANARGDLDARRRIEAEILGHDPTCAANNGSDRHSQ
jgi:hypothetical protein